MRLRKQRRDIMDDAAIPAEIKIYYSKAFSPVYLLSIFSGVLIGIYCLTHAEYAGGAFSLIVAVFFIYDYLKKYKNNAPQIIINDKGLRTAATCFYPWDEIGNEIVAYEERDDVKIYLLEYDCPNGHEEFEINGLAVDYVELIQWLAIYRQRSGEKYKYDL